MTNSRGHYKQEAYEQAISLRKRGFSYREIAPICGVSVGTVSAWLAAMPFSADVAKQNKTRAVVDNKKRLLLINKARTTEQQKQYAEAERLARVEYQNYRSNPLFMAGLMLYVAEGDTTHNRLIRLANSRPELHKVFIRFMEQYLGVERKRVRFWLLLYPDLDEVTCMQHWSKQIGISVGQFYKNQYTVGRSNNPTLHFGVGNTIIGSTLLKKKLNVWIALALKELK
jgi:predicted transcriptional regulator